MHGKFWVHLPPQMTYEQIISDLKNKKYAHIYFLCGEEPYYIDLVSQYIEKNVLEESEREFNLSILYGKETNVDTVISEAKRFPMMAAYTIVIVKEAQLLEKIEKIEPYIDNFSPTTILVFCYKYKTLDKRKSLAKKLSKSHVWLETKRLYADKIPDWITTYLKTKNYTIEPKAAILLAEFLGTNLSKIVSELEKLSIILPAGSCINSSDIEKNIGISKEFNAFELSNAIGARNDAQANRIAFYLGKSPKENPFVVINGILFSFFSKLLLVHATADKTPAKLAPVLGVNPFFVKDYLQAARNYPLPKCIQNVSLLREYDLRSKGAGNVSTSDDELLKELVYKLMH